MSINLHNLSDNVAIKYNDELHFGKESVIKFIKKNGNLFLDFDVNPIGNSHMLYGYNSLGNPVKIGFDKGKIQRIIMTSPQKYHRFLMTVSYDGKEYAGFQIQEDQPTIQGELSKIISAVNDEETLVQGASRTDAGVHAINQKAHFDSTRDIKSEKWLEILNHQLNKHIYVKSIIEVHPLFHSRYDVYKKRYTYRLKTKSFNPLKYDYSWYVENIDMEILKKSMEEIVGTHDFISYSKGEVKDTVRKIFNTEISENYYGINLIFEGNGFLRNMIRLLVQHMVELATGNSDVSVTDVLKEKSREHTKHMAPPNGLYLEEVIY